MPTARSRSPVSVRMAAVTVRDSVAASVPFAESVTVKAGATQRFRVPMPKLAKGSYVMMAVVDYGGTTMTAARARLDIR